MRPVLLELARALRSQREAVAIEIRGRSLVGENGESPPALSVLLARSPRLQAQTIEAL
jgi:hypothetical protein